ncbi:hypothetical protein K491DRAFT_782440 [Lophiostoma macrostomum CBS 122681]|uniref:Uncharacterized protein n=1 Tax=Lophiostoma macrostomum CBS 122681 TaxID=1314788 RepID=A0A6A6SUN5_9PLEO|nr:hypothetical protein K491DRAFT_782440 [Lophiostoma macrostomum CBS 122681]
MAVSRPTLEQKQEFFRQNLGCQLLAVIPLNGGSKVRAMPDDSASELGHSQREPSDHCQTDRTYVPMHAHRLAAFDIEDGVITLYLAYWSLNTHAGEQTRTLKCRRYCLDAWGDYDYEFALEGIEWLWDFLNGHNPPIPKNTSPSQAYQLLNRVFQYMQQPQVFEHWFKYQIGRV